MYLNRYNYIYREFHYLLFESNDMSVIFQYLNLLTGAELKFLLNLLDKNFNYFSKLSLLFSFFILDSDKIIKEDSQLIWTNYRKKFKKNIDLFNVRKFRRNRGVSLWLPAFRFKIYSLMYNNDIITLLEIIYRKGFFFLRNFIEEVQLQNYLLQIFFSKKLSNETINYEYVLLLKKVDMLDKEPFFIKIFFNENIIQKIPEVTTFIQIPNASWKTSYVFKDYNKRFIKKMSLKRKMYSKNLGLEFGGPFYNFFHEKKLNNDLWEMRLFFKNMSVVFLEKILILLNKTKLTFKECESYYKDLLVQRKLKVYTWEYSEKNIQLIYKSILRFKYGNTLNTVLNIEEKLENLRQLVGQKKVFVWNLIFKQVEILLIKMCLKSLKNKRRC